MLNYHIEKEADATIAVREVPWEDTYRFGIMNTTPENEIYEFDEKPKNAKNNKASMGVYIFRWDKLLTTWRTIQNTQIPAMISAKISSPI